MKKIFIASSLIVASKIACAGTFYVDVVGGGIKPQQVVNEISDVVSDKFTTKYPDTKWAIHIYMTTGNAGSDGTALVFAFAGVAPRNASGIMPANRVWTSMSRYPKAVNMSLVQKHPLMLAEMRQAVQNMMNDCQKSPNCDIDQ